MTDHMFSTPMMKQYMEIKEQYKDCLLFFRMGDFYELFLEDAKIGSDILDITLTSRAKGRDGRVPMAGVPYHSVDSYLHRLVKAGHKVAICEQLTPPDKSGIVERDVIRIVTPGTVLDEKNLSQKENNYIITFTFDTKNLGLAFADISTGQFHTAQIAYSNLQNTIHDELSRLNPIECILDESAYNDPWLLKILKFNRDMNIFPFKDWPTYAQNASNFLKKHFGVQSLISFGINDKIHALQSSAALLGYLKETQKDKIQHLTHIRSYAPDEFMNLDRSTITNLEIFSTLRDSEKKGSLTHWLDKTTTAMGGRLLRNWIKKPLTNKAQIEHRLDSVEEILNDLIKKENLYEKMKNITDIERILSRLSAGIGNARDLINLKDTLKRINLVKDDIASYKTELIKDLHTNISNELYQIIETIEKAIVDEPPLELKQGGLIKEGVDLELDRLKSKISGGKNWILDLEKEEKKRTGISSLKVGFNQVFGFYIEISKANSHLVPKNYFRKQTLVNAERYITPELKEKEEVILFTQEKTHDMEYNIFCQVLKKILDFTVVIQNAAEAIATFDCLLCFATLAAKYDYVKPKLHNFSDKETILIKKGRHPVVEQLLGDKQFVPNSTDIGGDHKQLFVITGPNMAGKSVYIRQVAIIILMAQLGCYVPAEKVELSVVDRIFVRSGAADMITSGLSTFMVEMVETAQILNHATEKSLVIMDEIGRGTSTYDGISIAWAVAEYLTEKIRAKTLFATHYHELQKLEKKNSTLIKNYHMGIKEENGQPVFLHQLIEGASSHSYGVAVAKLAGMPKKVIDKAYKILNKMENPDLKHSTEAVFHNCEDKAKTKSTLNDSSLSKDSIIFLPDELKNIDLYNMTPLQALNILAEVKKKYG
jgi:DNA mismatch repair protein MutS